MAQMTRSRLKIKCRSNIKRKSKGDSIIELIYNFMELLG